MHSGLELLSREVDTQKHFIAVNRLLGRLRSSHFGGANHIIVLLKVQGLAIASAVAVADCGLRRLGLPGFGTAGVRTGRGLLMTAILLAGLQVAVLIAEPERHGHQKCHDASQRHADEFHYFLRCGKSSFIPNDFLMIAPFREPKHLSLTVIALFCRSVRWYDFLLMLDLFSFLWGSEFLVGFILWGPE